MGDIPLLFRIRFAVHKNAEIPSKKLSEFRMIMKITKTLLDTKNVIICIITFAVGRLANNLF